MLARRFHTLFQVHGALLLLIMVLGFATQPADTLQASHDVLITVEVKNNCKLAIVPGQLSVNETVNVHLVNATSNIPRKLKMGEKGSATLLVRITGIEKGATKIRVILAYLVGDDISGYDRFSKSNILEASVPETKLLSTSFNIEETDCVRRLEWTGPLPQVLEKAAVGVPGSIKLVGQAVPRVTLPSLPRFYIMVMDQIYPSISASLSIYTGDLSSQYSVTVWTYSGSSPTGVRNWLASEYSSHPDLAGCLFVGDVPAAPYEIKAHEGWDYESFPCDLFYMDVNGIWSDTDGNGIYDQHSGNIAPEIFIGRLTASAVGDQTSLINNYFNKDHRYRTGLLSTSKRALVYVDDDWAYWADEDNNAMRLVYGNTVLVKDGATTTASDYKTRIQSGYEWVHLRCHGSPYSHTFKIGSDWTGGAVYSSDYFSNNYPVLFYQLFVCSAARYTSSNYLAGSIVFSPTYGLAVIGSTKTGSMLYFDDFYRPISQEKSMGSAFREWFITHGASSQDWFYGLTIIGDPLLTVREKGTTRIALDASPRPGYANKPVTIFGTLYGSWRSIRDGMVVYKPVTIATGWGFSTVVTTDYYGKFSVTTNCPSTGGTYAITATFYEDQDLLGNSTTIQYEVISKIPTVITVQIISIFQGYGVPPIHSVAGYLRTREGNMPVAGKTIYVTIRTAMGETRSYECTTDANGYYRIPDMFTDRPMSATAEFKGDETYASSSATITR